MEKHGRTHRLPPSLAFHSTVLAFLARRTEQSGRRWQQMDLVSGPWKGEPADERNSTTGTSV